MPSEACYRQIFHKVIHSFSGYFDYRCDNNNLAEFDRKHFKLFY